MSVIAIIPARGGSKRLPRKNILPLDGVPLVVRVINTCIKTGLFDKVIVSSEDPEILDIVSQTEAVAFKRNIDLAQDRSTVVEVCLDILQYERSADRFCCVYATSALLSANTLEQSYQYFKNEENTNVVMGVSEYNYQPVQALQIDDDGFARLLFSEYSNRQSQFYPKTRVSNGSYYWANSKVFKQECTFYSRKLKVCDVPLNEACDLDTKDDYLNMQVIFKKTLLR